METHATYDDVKLVLRLYELRRDDKLRDARQWFAKFNARTWAEKMELWPPGSARDAVGTNTMLADANGFPSRSCSASRCV